MNRLLLLVSGATLFFLAAAPSLRAQLRILPNGKVAIDDATGAYSQSLHILNNTPGDFDYAQGIVSDIRNGTAGQITYGIVGLSRNGSFVNQGVHGIATYTSPSAIGYGVAGVAKGPGTNYGVRGFANNGSTNYAGFFQGNVHVTGTLTNLADGRFKGSGQLLADSESVLKRLLRLQPQRFSYTNSSEFLGISLPEGDHFGVIAQEVEEVFPALVNEEVHISLAEEGSAGAGEPIRYKSVNYIEMIPLLLRAIQEQQAEIDELEAALLELR